MIFRDRFRLVIVLGCVAGVTGAAAQSDTIWSGLGTNPNWTTAGNWQSNVAPVNNGTATIRFGSSSRTAVVVNTSQSISTLTFDFSVGDISSYTLSGSSTTLTLGGGISVMSSINAVKGGVANLDSSLGITIGGAQTWTATNNSVLQVGGTISGTGPLTLTGTGYFLFSGNNTYTGGTTLNGTTLGIETDTALGAGPLTVTGNATLFSTTGARIISNAVNLNATLLKLLPYGGDFRFTALVTLGASSTISNYGQTVRFEGAIGESGSPRSLSLGGTGLVVLSGNNTYTGGTTVASGSLWFANANAVPTTGTLSSSAQGYIGTLFNTGVQTSFIAKFSPTTALGTIGFDTDPAALNSTVFAEPIDLSVLNNANNLARIGSSTRATLSSAAVITPPSVSGYRFGGGGGSLTVQSKLTGNNPLTVDSSGSSPLTVYLTNLGNDYTGTTSVTNSALVFAAGAVSSGSANGSFTLGTGSYIGTQDLTLLPSLWISKFATTSSTGVIGFDTSDVNVPFAVGSILVPINLTSFTGNGTSIALGTSSAAILAGTIALPAGQADYYFTGFKGGWLTVSSVLSGTHGVRIGNAAGYYPEYDPNDGTRVSTVFLNGSNTYSAGTSLFSGRLVLGDSSALGSGTLTVSGSTSGIAPQIETSLATNPTFANALVAQTALELGGAFGFTWSGNISNGASTGTITKSGASNLTLSGNNSAFSGGFYIHQGSITFATNSAAGTGELEFGSLGGIAAFTSNAPSIGGLASDTTSAQVQLSSGTTLTINQSSSETYRGQITGAGGIIKAGAAALRLDSASTYTGGTTITAGTVSVGATGALGNSTVTLNGATTNLKLDAGVTLANPIVFGASGGLLSGRGTLTSGVTLGANSGIAPGSSIGLLTFSNGLTWGPGGFYQVEVQDATGDIGTGWDSVQVTGALAFTATLGSPFTIYLSSITGSGASGTPANFVATSGYTWRIATATNLSGFNLSAITLNTSGFTTPLNGGFFNVGAVGNTLVVNFTPVPEPSTWALLLGGVGVLAITRRRRK